MHSEGALYEGGRRVREGNMMTQAEEGTERGTGRRRVGGDLKMPSADFENGGRGHQPRNASGLSGPFTTAATGNSYRELLILKVIKLAQRKPQIYRHVHIYVYVYMDMHMYMPVHTYIKPYTISGYTQSYKGLHLSHRLSVQTVKTAVDAVTVTGRPCGHTRFCARCLLTALHSLCLTDLKTLLWVLETLRLIPVHFSFTLACDFSSQKTRLRLSLLPPVSQGAKTLI